MTRDEIREGVLSALSDIAPEADPSTLRFDTDLRDQLEAYPELSNELEGLADVIDLLREAGERRRRRGEEVLRELLEGDGEGEGEGRDEEGEDAPPKRPKR